MIWKVSGNKDLSQEGSPGPSFWPLPIPFSHSRIGAQTGGNVPWRVVVSIRTQAPRSAEGFPALATCWLQVCNPPALLPRNCCQAPQDSFVQCVVLFMLLLQQFKQDFCFQFAEMETSVCNFANPCQGPLFLF